MRLEYFQMIDRVVDLNLDERTIRVESTIPTASPVFEGHFPDFPLMPGVLLIEAMAQTSGWLIIGLNKFARMPFLAAVREAKLRSFVLPGQTLSLSAGIVHEGSGFTITKASIELASKPICSAEITLRLMEFPTSGLRDNMEKIATAIGLPVGAPAHG
jgi:3-hydroxyacyl-[acyl-carrier-protein] dehydratase